MGAGWGDYKRGWMGRLYEGLDGETIGGAGWGDYKGLDGGWMGRLYEGLDGETIRGAGWGDYKRGWMGRL